MSSNHRYLHASAQELIEMRVSVSENFKIWRWIGFLFFRIKKSSGGAMPKKVEG
jgi:hypothetical protein